MILDIVLSVVLTFGVGGPTGDFNECPAASDSDTVATSQYTTSSTGIEEA